MILFSLRSAPRRSRKGETESCRLLKDFPDTRKETLHFSLALPLMQTGLKATGKITTKALYNLLFKTSFYQLPQGCAGATYSALKPWIAHFPKQKEASPQNWLFLRAAVKQPWSESCMVCIVGHDSPLQGVGAGEEHSSHGTAAPQLSLIFHTASHERRAFSHLHWGFTSVVQKRSSLPLSPSCRGTS